MMEELLFKMTVLCAIIAGGYFIFAHKHELEKQKMQIERLVDNAKDVANVIEAHSRLHKKTVKMLTKATYSRPNTHLPAVPRKP